MAEFDLNPEDPREAEVVAAEAEVRLGTNRMNSRGGGGNTIIEVLHPDLFPETSSLLALPRGQRNPEHRYHETSILDWIILAIRSFIERIFYQNSDGQPSVDSTVLENEEIDKLAVYQECWLLELYMREWLPVDLPESKKLARVNLYWRLLEDEDHVEWERRCRHLLGPSTMMSYLVKERDTYRAKLRCFLGSWGSGREHCSPNIFLLDDHITAHRIPCVNQTDSIRGKLGFDEGIHAWDMRIMGEIGTHCSVGICTKDANFLTKLGYLTLVGDDEYSWGWDIRWGNLSNAGETKGSYPKKKVYQYSPGDFIRLVLDCDEGILSYAVNERFFGIAFDGLPKAIFYPCVGLVYGNSEVSLVYLGTPPPLRNSK